MFGGRGGILAPDLTEARSRYLPDQLLAAMSAPWSLVAARSNSGSTVRGVKKAEDTFTLQLMDEQRRWHFLKKREIRITTTSRPHTSLNVEDESQIVAFLYKAPQAYEPPTEWKPAKDFDVTYSRLLQSSAEPHNWLTYWGDLAGRHYSGLKQVTPANVSSLKSQWTFQLGGNTIETTPLVVDGMMFVTGPLNNAAALDARTGQPSVEVHPSSSVDFQPLHRNDESWTRCVGRPAVHGHARHAPGRA